MTIRNRFPTIEPSLDLNFAGTKRLDARIAFTRASSGSYVDEYGVLRIAGNNEPRFDHHPTTGESLGLLVEEQRTNLVLRSEEFNSSPWTLNNSATITANADIATNGTITADQFNGAATTSTGVFAFPATVSGFTYTFSVYIKNVSNASVLKLGVDSNPVNATVTFNAVAGTISSAGANVTSYSVVSVGNGWNRITITFISTGASAGVVIYSMSGSTATWLAWGAQLEAGAFPTSYIPTTTAAVTRSADVCSITGSNFSSWYRQDEGTVFAAWQLNAGSVSQVRHVANINNLPETDQATVFVTTANTISQNTFISGISQGRLDSGALAAFTPYSSSFSYSSAGRSFTTNAASVSTGSGTVQTATKIEVGNYNGVSNLNGTIRRLTYWPARLPNSTLQTLTQP